MRWETTPPPSEGEVGLGQDGWSGLRANFGRAKMARLGREKKDRGPTSPMPSIHGNRGAKMACFDWGPREPEISRKMKIVIPEAGKLGGQKHGRPKRRVIHALQPGPFLTIYTQKGSQKKLAGKAMLADPHGTIWRTMDGDGVAMGKEKALGDWRSAR